MTTDADTDPNDPEVLKHEMPWYPYGPCGCGYCGYVDIPDHKLRGSVKDAAPYLEPCVGHLSFAEHIACLAVLIFKSGWMADRPDAVRPDHWDMAWKLSKSS